MNEPLKEDAATKMEAENSTNPEKRDSETGTSETAVKIELEKRAEIRIPTKHECPRHEEDECPRDRMRHFSIMPDVIFDYLSSCYVFFYHTMTLETLLVLINTTGATVFFLLYEDDGHVLASKLDFSLVSFAIVFPLTFLLQQVFTRREGALKALSEFRALLQHTTISLLNWEFQSSVNKDVHFNGRIYLPEHFEEDVLENSTAIVDLLDEYLREPEVTRARHLFVHRTQLCTGKKNERKMHSEFVRLLDNSYRFCEILKYRGMPGNESSRINQYHWMIHCQFENLRNYKWYRTPQSTRSYGRIYIMIIPWFYGPYYAWCAGEGVTVNTETDEVSQLLQTNFAFALCLSLFTSLVLIGLVNAGRRLEDPFTENGIDVVHVAEEFQMMRILIHESYERAVSHRALPRRPLPDDDKFSNGREK